MLYRCYAKVNLTLEVLGKRDDGFHELASLVHTISLADDLRIEPAHNLLTRVEGFLKLSVKIDPGTNLVSRAAELLAKATGERRGAELTLIKRVPTAAGLGGGSSDAATTLVGLNSLWQSRLGVRQLRQLAQELGSDVPFFLRGGAALMSGRGERLRAVPPLLGQWLVLVVPPHDVLDKTRRLYGALEVSDFSSGDATARAAERLQHRKPLRETDLTNAFQRVARGVFQGLNETWSQAEQLAQRRFFLSGAGPAIFALASDRADARRQAMMLQTLDAEVSAVRTVTHARVMTP